ncbi:MAG TPA: response regulator transcription factor [Steroidobacteraceae bacterium]|nr:response regulator transcription factor [Steroidobacteraceae bacterium]
MSAATMAAAPITVLLVDDHAVVRQGYGRLLARDPAMQVVAEAASAQEALECERRCQPDVVVLDIALPGVSGIETARRLIARRGAVRILMFSMYQDAIYASRAFEAGALGYLSKSSAPELLVEAVRAVAAGRRYVSPDVAQAMAVSGTGGGGVAASLSGREHEILRLLTSGYELAEIGARLGVSTKTVANHQSVIKNKLGATSALQLILVARQLGIN